MDQAPLRKVYYHHLKKCGGTSLNRWLDGQFPHYEDNFRQIQITAYSAFADEPNRFVGQRRKMQAFAQSIFAARDLCHDHSGIAAHVPDGTFRFTVLRDPSARLLSQIGDFRRMSDTTIAEHPPAVRAVLTDAKTLRVKDFLHKHGRKSGPYLHFLNNYMTRAIAHNRVGIMATTHPDAKALVPVALETLERDFDFVGLLSEIERTQALLAAQLGWMPPQDVPVLNEGKGKLIKADESEEAAEILAEINTEDEVLLAFGRKLFERASARIGQVDLTTFERDAASARMGALHAKTDSTMMWHGMDQPINAAGHSGRHANPKGHCWVWTSARATFTLYMPAPAGLELTLSVRCLETSDDGILDRLSVAIDGAPAPHRVRRGPGQQIWIDVDHEPGARDFARFEIRTPDGTVDRALRIDRYGWRLRALD